jgi:uncharacterized protein (TIGR03089 family)
MTFYDDATGERVELSAQTLANWVTKTVNLLIDDLEVEPGTRVSLHLPRHWLAAVWIIALDAVNADLLPDDRLPDDGDAAAAPDLVVVGPAGVPDALHGLAPDSTEVSTSGYGGGPEVFAVSLAPMATPFGTAGNPPLPPGTRDFCAEVRLMPDQVISLPTSQGLWAREGLTRAQQLGLQNADRVAAAGEGLGRAAYLQEWIAPLSVDGSAVWTRNPDPQKQVSRWTAEQVTVVLTGVPDGVSVPPGVRLVVPPGASEGG